MMRLVFLAVASALLQPWDGANVATADDWCALGSAHLRSKGEHTLSAGSVCKVTSLPDAWGPPCGNHMWGATHACVDNAILSIAGAETMAGQSLAIIVGSPKLGSTPVGNLRQMGLVNFYSAIMEYQ